MSISLNPQCYNYLSYYSGLGINLPAKRVLVASGHTNPTSDSEMSEIIDLTTVNYTIFLSVKSIPQFYFVSFFPRETYRGAT